LSELIQEVLYRVVKEKTKPAKDINGPMHNEEKYLREVSDEELMKFIKEIFGDVDEFWKGLHPSVQRLVSEYMRGDFPDWHIRVSEYERQLKESGLTKEEVCFKPKKYSVGGYEIRIDLPDPSK